MHLKTLALAALLALPVAHAAEPAAAPAAKTPTKAADDVMVHDPFVRAAPGGAQTAGGFGHFMNHSGTPHAIVKASSPASKVVELHTHVEENGVFRMRPIPKIDLPAGGGAMLAPGGLHLMFIGLVKPLAAGQKVLVTVTFEDGTSSTFEAEVKAFAGASGAPPAKGHEHHGH